MVKVVMSHVFFHLSIKKVSLQVFEFLQRSDSLFVSFHLLFEESIELGLAVFLLNFEPVLKLSEFSDNHALDLSCHFLRLELVPPVFSFSCVPFHHLCGIV
jgi:hypothetical protein